MPVFNNALAGAAGSGGAAGYTIERSLRFNRSDSAYLSRTPSGGNRKKWTLSFWYKPSLGTGSHRHCIIEARNASNDHSVINFRHDHKFEVYHYSSSTLQFQVLTTAYFRDPSAWYHFVLAYDTDQSGADKVKIFCNGIRITQFDVANYPSNSYGDALWSDNNTPHTIGKHGTQYLHGYLAEYQWLDGSAPGISTDDVSGSVTGTPSAQYLTDFGKFDSITGVWNPIEYTHTITPSEAISYGVDNTSNVFDGYPGNHDTTGLSFGTWPGTIQNSNVGGYGANSVQVLKTNSGNAVTWTINTGNTNRYIHTSSDGINWTTNLTTISGTAVQVTSAWLGWGGGANTDYTTVSVPEDTSFHLNFSDDSTQAALGTDSSGNNNTWLVHNLTHTGTVYQNNGSITVNNGRTDSVGSFAAVFNGTNNANAANAYGFLSGAMDFTWNLDTPIPFTSQLRVWTGFSGGTVHLNGDSTGVASVGNGYTTLATSSGTLSSIRFVVGSSGGWWSSVLLDGNMLVSGNPVNYDSLIDSPTNYAASSGNNGGNYCTWNPLNKGSSISTSDGNLKAQLGSTGHAMITGTMGMTSGKYYWEVVTDGWNTSNQGPMVGVVGDTHAISTQAGGSPTVLYRAEGKVFVNNSTAASSLTTYTAGNVIGVALDLDNNNITWYKDGSQVHQYTSLDSTVNAWLPAWKDSDSGGYAIANFGQRPFTHTPPTGFKPLCTTNLPDPLIADGSAHFDTKLWTGTNTNAAVTVTGYKFSPEFIWAKSRSHAFSHNLYDIVRNTGKGLYSDTYGAEVTNNQYGYVSAFTSDGFTASPGSTDNDFFNGTNKTYVAFGWNAGDTNTPISVGGLNSSVYNQSQTWSSNVSGGSGAYGAAANAFDGSLSTNASPEYSSPMTYTNPSASDTVISTFEIYGRQYSSSVTVELNDTSISSQISSTTQWHTITGFSGQNFSKLYWRPTSGNAEIRIHAIRVNGKILVDSGTSLSGLTQYPSIASTVRANPTAGFSIVTYSQGATGSVVAHGLNKKPDMIIAKSRTASNQPWVVYHSALGKGGVLQLHETAANNPTYPTYWGSNEPDSNVFGTYTGSVPWANNDGDMVAYCFTSIEGYSAFGSYTGNGSADGPFVYTGFKVAWLLIKRTDATKSWQLIDNARSTFNVTDDRLFPDDSSAESNGSNFNLDFLSNGFKCRTAHNSTNASGGTYIYIAFAENPFKTARAR